MNVDLILETFNRHRVDYLLIGGMNFLLRHEPVLTYDVDLWIEDSVENRARCIGALEELGAEWGATEEDWGPVQRQSGDWLDHQAVFCFTSPHGAIDLFRGVKGLSDWQRCAARALAEQTAAGISYRGLADADMLRCQEALDPQDRKSQRMAVLRRSLENR